MSYEFSEYEITRRDSNLYRHDNVYRSAWDAYAKCYAQERAKLDFGRKWPFHHSIKHLIFPWRSLKDLDKSDGQDFVHGHYNATYNDLKVRAEFKAMSTESELDRSEAQSPQKPLPRLEARGTKDGLAGTQSSSQLESQVAQNSHPVKAQNSEPPHWKLRIQTEATAYVIRQRKLGASPTVKTIKDQLATWCRENNVMTDSRIFPTANYLRTHVLGGKHWRLPP